jgi:outer membrane lipoprotein LolB
LPVAARRATVALLALLATGCALQPPAAPPAVDWAARGAALMELAGWQARGRIALKAEGRGGQGDLAWQQSGAQARIRVSGPFGAGAYDIRWDPAGLSVASRDGEFSRAWTGADAAEQFLAEQVGWSFPAVSTRWWLLALPDPEHPAEQTLAADGSLAELTQNGWTVRYERYVESGGWPMPARLTVESERARLRVVIDRWCLAPDCLDSP